MQALLQICRDLIGCLDNVDNLGDDAAELLSSAKIAVSQIEESAQAGNLKLGDQLLSRKGDSSGRHRLFCIEGVLVAAGDVYYRVQGFESWLSEEWLLSDYMLVTGIVTEGDPLIHKPIELMVYGGEA